MSRRRRGELPSGSGLPPTRGAGTLARRDARRRALLLAALLGALALPAGVPARAQAGAMPAADASGVHTPTWAVLASAPTEGVGTGAWPPGATAGFAAAPAAFPPRHLAGFARSAPRVGGGARLERWRIAHGTSTAAP